jgi:transposase InsO family protein
VQRFCRDFAPDAGPLFDILKGPAKRVIAWTDEQREHFQSLKMKIASTPVLAIPDFGKPFGMRMDASEHANGGVLFQEEVRGDDVVERPIAFGGRKYKDAEKNYSIREKELLAIRFGLRLWRVYLLDKPFVVETDHRSLETIFTQKTISRRVARWYDELSEYPVTFRYIKGKDNSVADGISRRPDFMKESTATLAAITTRKQIRQRPGQGLPSLVDEATSRYSDDPITADLEKKLRTGKAVHPPVRHFERYSLRSKRLFYQAPSDSAPRLVLPNISEIIEALLYEFHDAKCYGHPGVERTLRLVENEYYWRNMERSVRAYVRPCEVCQRTKCRNTKPPGLLRAHSIPSARWTHLAMDFIVALPETEDGYDAIMVVIDRLTKRAHFVPTTTIATALETAKLYRNRVFSLHGIPEEILSDRDPKFTSVLWTSLCEMLGTRQKLTTAFRQQANGVTERVNQTIENYLRAFSNSNSDDWDGLLALAEFAYNSRYQASINMSPFEADLGYLPATPASWRSVRESSERAGNAACTLSKEFLERQRDLLAKARRALQASQDRMSNIYDKNRPVQHFELGDRVLLSTTNLATFHAGTTKKKLGPKWIGPYTVVEQIGHDYYRLELPTRVKFHPVFHTSMLKPYVHSDRPDQAVFKVRLPDGTEGELVEDIVGYRHRNGRAEYHVKWLGQSQLTWEPRENLEYVLDLVNRFHQRHATTKPPVRKRRNKSTA